MTDKFKVMFAIATKDGKALNPVQKGTAEIFFAGEVVDDYNIAAAELNGHYEEWNLEYDANNNGEKYDDFIIRKCNEVLDAMDWVNKDIKPRMGYFPGEDQAELLIDVFDSIWAIRLEPIK